jgi:multicomponent Na+:H+ antiporter subunit D
MSPALPALLFLVPFVAALLAGLLGWFVRGWARWTAIVAAVLEVALACHGVLGAGPVRTRAFMGGWPPPLGIEWALDPLGALAVVLVVVTSGLVLVGVPGLVRAELDGREPSFYVAALLLESALLGMVLTADLFNFFVHLEVAALCSYALVAAGGRGAPRAALRYLVMGTLGASSYLLGVGMLYAATGSLNMSDVAARLAHASPALAATGGALVVVGLALKMGLFPLHGWMPAAYARAPAAAAALMAPLVTKVSALALLRIVGWVLVPHAFGRDAGVLPALSAAGTVAIVAGAVLALRENDLRRLLAYSSVSQMGIVAAGIGLGHPTALTGAVVHIVADTVAKAVLFLVAGVLAVRWGIRDVRQLGRLRGTAPALRAIILVAGLSLVGLPPLMGFYGKWYVVTAALEQDAPWVVAAVGVGTMLTVAYVFRIVERLFLAPRDEASRAAPPLGVAGPLGSGGVLAAGLVLFALASGPLLHLIEREALLAGR